MTKLISMAHKPGEGEAVPGPVAQSEYPYGLRITFNEPQLEALGFKSLPVAGTPIHLEAIAVVTRSSTEDPDADGDVDYVCVELQLTQLGIEEATEEEPTNAVERRERAISKLWPPRKAKAG